MGSYSGARAVVAGSASGAGTAVTAALLDRGARVDVLDLEPTGLGDTTIDRTGTPPIPSLSP
jgi:nucleoside-diphosphate-sugar epimerase